MTEILHAACSGCYDPIFPVTAGQLFGLVLVGALAVAMVAAVLIGLDRYNR